MTKISFLTTLLLIVAIPAHASKSPDCGAMIKAVNIWEDEVDGKIVTKTTVFPLPDWDPNAQFDGLVLMEAAVKAVKEPVLEIEYAPKGKGKVKKKLETLKVVKPLEQNPALQIFDGFEPREFFTFERAGTYTVRLKSNATVVCSETHAYNLGH